MFFNIFCIFYFFFKILRQKPIFYPPACPGQFHFDPMASGRLLAASGR